MRSDTLIPILVVAAFFVLVIGPIFWTIFRRRRRAREMSEGALRLGFSYEADGRPLLEEGVSNLPLFSLASLRRGSVVNVMRGNSGQYSVVICDCLYSTSTGGRGRSAREQTAFCFDVKGVDLPDFSLAPRGSTAERQMMTYGIALKEASPSAAAPVAGSSLKDFVAAAFRAAADKGIEIPERPEFSSRYYLWAEQREAVESLFLERAVGYFEQQEKPLPSVQKAGNWLVVFRRNKLVPAETLPEALAEAATIRALFPTNW